MINLVKGRRLCVTRVTLAILFSICHAAAICSNGKIQIGIVASLGAQIDNVFFKRLPEEVKILVDITTMQYGTASLAMLTYGSDLKVVQGFSNKWEDFSNVSVVTEPMDKVSVSESLIAVAKLASDTNLGWQADAFKHIILILSVPSNSSKVQGNEHSQSTWATLRKKGISIHFLVDKLISQSFFNAWVDQLAKNGNMFYMRTYDKFSVALGGFLAIDSHDIRQWKSCDSASELWGRSMISGQCSADHTTKLKLQVTFLVDRTASFQPFFRQFGPGAKQLVRDIVAYFPGSEFALASFCDYKLSQMVNGDEDSSSIADENNGCYGVFQKMTHDPDEFEKSMVEMKVCEGGDFPECVLTALLFTAMDSHLGWTLGAKDMGGNLLLRLIILLTDTESHQNWTVTWQEGHKRRNPKGDGHDTCENSFIPSESLVASRLAQRGIHVIGFITQSALGYWTKLFGSSFKGIKNTLYEMDFNNIKDLAPEIKKAITTDVACDQQWEDPPGFNLLGL